MINFWITSRSRIAQFESMISLRPQIQPESFLRTNPDPRMYQYCQNRVLILSIVPLKTDLRFRTPSQANHRLKLSNSWSQIDQKVSNFVKNRQFCQKWPKWSKMINFDQFRQFWSILTEMINLIYENNYTSSITISQNLTILRNFDQKCQN